MNRALCFVSSGLVGLTFVLGVILSGVGVFAEDVRVSNVNVAIPASCELSGTGTLHSANVNNGTYQEDIGKTTLTVFCNDGGGYALYAVGFTGEEVGGTDSTKLIGITSDLKISTGAYIQGTTTDSVWSMKVSKVTDSSVSYSPANLTIENGFSSYSAVPADYTKVASFTSTTDLTLGSKLETTYAAFVSGLQRADTYNGKVKYTLVHPSSNVPNGPTACTAGNICYWPNGGNIVTDSMGDQTVDSSAAEVTLWASNFQRQGYGFAGWSTTYDYSDPNGFLGPNEDIDDATTLATIQSEGLSLYAYWIPSAGNLQGWNGCSGMSIGDVTALTDQRDNDTYAVAKLADGKCWMIENLRLDYDAIGNTDGSLAQGYGGVFIGLAEPETNNYNTLLKPANTLYKSDGSGDIAGINGATLSDVGTTSGSEYCIPRYSNNNTNTNSTINPNTTVTNMTDTNQNIFSYGNLYTWSAALANTKSYTGQNITDGNGKTSETVNTSICPSGWRLPYGAVTGRGNTPGGYYYLNYTTNANSNVTNATASKKLRAYPNNFVYSGYASEDTIYRRGQDGSYWSSTTYDSSYSYHFGLGSTYVGPGTYTYSKNYGRSIRCVIGS